MSWHDSVQSKWKENIACHCYEETCRRIRSPCIQCTSFVPAASPRALSPSPEHSHKKCVLVFIILMYDYPPPSQNYSKVTVLFSDFDKQSLAVEFDGMVISWSLTSISTSLTRDRVELLFLLRPGVRVSALKREGKSFQDNDQHFTAFKRNRQHIESFCSSPLSIPKWRKILVKD